MNIYMSALRTAIDGGAVIVLAGTGELLMERTGVLCLGLEGIVSIGAVSAVIAASHSASPWLCLLAACLGGMLLGLVFGLATVVARANQVLCGLAVVLIGTALANQLGQGYSGRVMRTVFRPVDIPLLVKIPQVGPALFHHDPLVYFCYVVLPAVVAFALFGTRHGMNLRAIGQNPAAADAVGLAVTLTRLIYTIVGGALAGAGGAALSMSFTPGWSPGLVAGRGWVAIAVVIFASWRPFRLVFGALLFGAMISLSFIAQDRGWGLPAPVLNMAPYVVTLILIAVPAIIPRFRRSTLAPAALAVPYFREER